MIGQFSELERKSIEPIALKVEGGNIRSMQRFVSDVVWDTERMLSRHHELVSEDIGDPDGVLIFDESGFVKKGEDSVGVAKQYCGNVGKVENGQSGVFAAFFSPWLCSLNGSLLFGKVFEVNLRREPKNVRGPMT
jgi:SRSO17 transposase